jgi:hypothetical protein
MEENNKREEMLVYHACGLTGVDHSVTVTKTPVTIGRISYASFNQSHDLKDPCKLVIACTVTC